MVLPVDKIWLENIQEFVLDDGKFVSYKWLSCKLGVHVNLAKQMLWSFLEEEKRRGRGEKVHTIYYISGMALQKTISDMDRSRNPFLPEDDESDGDDDKEVRKKGAGDVAMSPDIFAEEDSPSPLPPDQDAFLVMLCRDKDLEETRARFTKVFSIHVYGVSTFPMKLKDLNKYCSEKIEDDQGRPPMHYGCFTCKAAYDFRPDPRRQALMQNIADVKAKVAEDKEKWLQEEGKKKEKEASNNTIVKKASNAQEKGKDKGDRLKNMFAAAASKPKAVIPEKEEKVVPQKRKDLSPKKKEDKKESTWSKKPKSQAKPKGKIDDSRKRKRIRDVLSSSDEEDSKKASSDDEASKSPPRRKPMEISSDSDSDSAFKDPPKNNNNKEKKAEEKTPKGRRRVNKTVPKRYVDDDGFLVTEMEQIMVSESDSNPASESEENKPEKATDDIIGKKVVKTPTKKPPQKPKALPPSAGKKQASIMSFFTKK